jgi:parallel beta-helix repeat protein
MKKNFRLKRSVFLGSGITVLLIISLFIYFFVIAERIPAGAIVVPRDFPTIQSAIDHAQPGTTIIVKAGEGPFQGPLLIQTADLKIVSTNGKAILECEDTEPAITVRSEGVTLRGFVIRVSGIGVRVENAVNCLLENTAIEGAHLGIQLIGCHSSDFRRLTLSDGEIGIQMTSSSRNTFEQIQLRRLDDAGIRLIDSRLNRVEKVTVTEADLGISLEGGSEKNRILSCELQNCTTAGVKILDSQQNTLTQNTFDRGANGILLYSASGNTVSDNQLSYSSIHGIALYKSNQNVLSGNNIVAAQQYGTSLFDSDENTLTHNNIDRCKIAGMNLENAKKNLLFGNTLKSNMIGIQASTAHTNRILRNVVQDSSLAGITLTQGEDNLFLDNTITKNSFGIALIAASGNQLLRNTVADNSRNGISFLNEAHQNFLQANTIEKNDAGVLIACSSGNTIAENSVSDNNTGVMLFRPGSRTQVDANSIARNVTGVEIADKLDNTDIILSEMGLDLLPGEEDFRLILTNNTFAQNKSYDIRNQTEETIFAGGNYWKELPLKTAEGQARVSGNVILPKSSWEGIIAVGTENSLDQVIIGRLLQLVLEEAGFKVIDLIGLGDAEKLMEAFLSGDVELICEDPKIVNAWGMSSTEARVFPLLAVENKLSVAISPQFASNFTEKSTSELARVIAQATSAITFVVPTAISENEFHAFASAYDMTIPEENVIWTDNIEETEATAKLPTTDIGIVNRIEETLSLMGFELLRDDRNFFEASQTVFVSQEDLLKRYSELATIEKELRILLTTEIVHSLATRVRLLYLDPREVTREFMLQEGLIEQ